MDRHKTSKRAKQSKRQSKQWERKPNKNRRGAENRAEQRCWSCVEAERKRSPARRRYASKVLMRRQLNRFCISKTCSTLSNILNIWSESNVTVLVCKPLDDRYQPVLEFLLCEVSVHLDRKPKRIRNCTTSRKQLLRNLPTQTRHDA